jgi:acyl dehydratase
MALVAAGIVLCLLAFFALGRGWPGRCLFRTLLGVTLLALGGLVAAAVFGMQGYRALTREDVVGVVHVRPVGPQRFDANVRLADGRQLGFVLAGDELYMDAHILKWKPIASVFGLHTAYQLDRIAGRYRSLEQERTSVRTVHSIAPDTPIDLFDLRRRFAFLAPLYDAQYGSATFVAVTRPAELELRLSTTGLLIREAAPQAGK